MTHAELKKIGRYNTPDENGKTRLVYERLGLSFAPRTKHALQKRHRIIQTPGRQGILNKNNRVLKNAERQEI